jgi:pimeloyl-ACP methyl ester carboxylesterase
VNSLRFVERDGVRLGYEVVGDGEPAMVFVHGWTCDVSHFAPQVAHYAVSHRCVSVDLRGHGASDAPEQEYTIEGFADDVAFVCDELGVRDAVLVGHSMGGAIVLAVGASRPDLARGVVMLDPAILFPAEAVALIGQLAGAFAGPGGMAALRQFGEGQFFLATSDPRLKQRTLDGMVKTKQHVVASAFRNLPSFDAAAALSALRASAMYVGAEPSITDVGRLRELAPGIMVGNTVGAGHFHQLEVPGQVNAMIDRFLELVAAT